MEPWEVMISESQERMVAIVAPERLAEVEAVIDRWELHRAVIGEVTDSGELRALWHGEEVGAIPARFLTGGVPPLRRRAHPARAPARDPDGAAADARPRCSSCSARRAPLARVRHAPLRPARAVAHRAPPRSRRRRAAAAPVVPRPRAHARRQGASARSTRVSGGMLAILEAARNVACAGGEPLGFTDCLNFGNPEKPEIGWELAESIEGMAQACEALGLPIVSGNVSLYNDTDGRSIHPTPVVGCVGLVADVRRVPGRWSAGDVVAAWPARRARSRSPAPRPRPATAPSAARRRLDLAAEAALVRFTTAIAPRARSPTTSPRAASRSRSPRPRSGAASAPRSTSRRRPRRAVRRGRRPGASSRCPPDQVEVDPTGSDVAGAADRRGRRRRGARRAARRPPCRVGGGRAPDVRRLRRPLGRARRGAAHVLRPLRAAASRAGVGRDRRLRGRARDGAPRHGARRRRSSTRSSCGAARRGRDRPHPLLDDRRRALVERAAARPPRARRAPSRSATTATSTNPPTLRDELVADGHPARLDLRHRGDRRPDRPRPRAAARGRGRDDARGSRARTRSSRSSTARSSPSATRTGSARSRSAASATTGSSPRRPARST